MKALLNLFATVCFIPFPLLSDIPEPYNSEQSPTSPLSPSEAAQHWDLPAPLQATVFAAEPHVRQPIAMAFDDRGRLWVAECYTYSEVRIGFEESLRDRILILEDTDHDGHFDHRTVFIDGLQRLTSIEIGFGGVWALTSPTLIFIADHDANDQPDGPAEILLDGFDWKRNHHTLANGLRWGPDGWLYGRHGIQATSSLGIPGTADSHRARINGGIWRYHPQRQTVEIVCHGTTNPWGMDWNAYGEPFFINTVIGHVWHAIPGAHFRRMHGNDLNPFTYEIIEQTADHLHWASNEAWNTWQKIGTSPATSAAGGGHAHTGLLFYQGNNWPPSWNGKLLTINFNGRRLNVESVQRNANESHYIARHQPDIGFSADPWFRGIDLITGPEGAVYIADWSDTGECHDATGVHRSSGRIYRIANPSVPHAPLPHLDSLTPEQWIPLLDHPNIFIPRHVQRKIQERTASGLCQNSIQTLLCEKLQTDPDEIHQLRALWALHASGGTTPSLLISLLQHPSEHLRTWAIRLLVDDPTTVPATTQEALISLAEREPSAFVRLSLAAALQRLPLDNRAELARPLLRQVADAEAPNIPQMLWYGIEPLAKDHPMLLAQLAQDCQIPLTLRCITRRLAEIHSEPGSSALGILLQSVSQKPESHHSLLSGILSATRSTPMPQIPVAWSEAARNFADNPDPTVRNLFFTLGTLFADPFSIAQAQRAALNSTLEPALRQNALRALVTSKTQGFLNLCMTLAPDSDLTPIALEGIRQNDQEETARYLLKLYPSLNRTQKGLFLDTLLTRPTWTHQLLQALESHSVPSSDFTAFHARKVLLHNDPDLQIQVEKAWGKLSESTQTKLDNIQLWKGRLTGEGLADADPQKGRELFLQLCATCHLLHGQGTAMGPELTGSNRGDLDYLLHNIIDPNATLPEEYYQTVLYLKDDQILSGFIRTQSPQSITLQTLTGQQTLLRDQIQKIETTPSSLMPEGLLDPLTPEQVRNLIRYLMTP